MQISDRTLHFAITVAFLAAVVGYLLLQNSLGWAIFGSHLSGPIFGDCTGENPPDPSADYKVLRYGLLTLLFSLTGGIGLTLLLRRPSSRAGVMVLSAGIAYLLLTTAISGDSGEAIAHWVIIGLSSGAPFDIKRTHLLDAVVGAIGLTGLIGSVGLLLYLLRQRINRSNSWPRTRQIFEEP